MLFTSGLWLAWPWIVALVSPVPTSGAGGDLVVVLDLGSSRLEQAERFRQQVLQEHPPQGPRLEPEQLLIRCPRSPPPPPLITGPPMLQLLEGYDTVTQITALSGWLQRRPAPAPRRTGSPLIRAIPTELWRWPASPWPVVASRFSQTPATSQPQRALQLSPRRPAPRSLAIQRQHRRLAGASDPCPPTGAVWPVGLQLLRGLKLRVICRVAQAYGLVSAAGTPVLLTGRRG